MSTNGSHGSNPLTTGPARAAARAMLKAVGFSDADLKKPLIGVANTWIEIGPCNYHLRTLAADVKDGVRAAGGTPTVSLNTSAVATYIDGSGSKVLRFSYTVAAGQNTADLNATSMALGGSTIRDGSDNNATLTLPGGSNSLAGGHAIVVDTIAPTIARFQSDTPAGTYGAGQTVDIDAIFCANESSTFGMLRVLQDNGWAGKVKFVGFDASASLVKSLRDGDLDALVVQDPVRMGYLGVKTVVSHLKGEKVERRIDTGVRVIARDEMDTPEAKELLQPDLDRWLKKQ